MPPGTRKQLYACFARKSLIGPLTFEFRENNGAGLGETRLLARGYASRFSEPYRKVWVRRKDRARPPEPRRAMQARSPGG